jgi:hypothetical protein
LGAAAGGVFGRGEGCARVAAAEVAAAVGRGDGRRGTAAQNEKKEDPFDFEKHSVPLHFFSRKKSDKDSTSVNYRRSLKK